MSTIAFASLTNVRDDSDPEVGQEIQKPGVNPYVDTTAALVPAEVLGLHALLLSFTTETTLEAGASHTATSITEGGATAMQWSFWGLMLLSVILFVAGRGTRHWNKLDFVRGGIPPLAFVAWTMLQKTTAFDAVYPELAMEPRIAIALFAAVILGVVTAWLARKASETPVT